MYSSPIRCTIDSPLSAQYMNQLATMRVRPSTLWFVALIIPAVRSMPPVSRKVRVKAPAQNAQSRGLTSGPTSEGPISGRTYGPQAMAEVRRETENTLTWMTSSESIMSESC